MILISATMLRIEVYSVYSIDATPFKRSVEFNFSVQRTEMSNVFKK